MMKRIIDEVFFEAYGTDELLRGDDAAVLPALAPGERIAYSTDSFVVTPHFFPGGDIGRLAVCGTVNDVATSGARPLYLSCAFILEEGFPMDDLRRIDADGSHVAIPPKSDSEGSAKIYDNDVLTKWLDSVPTLTTTWTFDDGRREVINKYAISAANDMPARDPAAWTLYGSNNGEESADLTALLEGADCLTAYPFLREIPAEQVVAPGGWDIYCIVPADENADVAVNEYGWLNEGAELPRPASSSITAAVLRRCISSPTRATSCRTRRSPSPPRTAQPSSTSPFSAYGTALSPFPRTARCTTSPFTPKALCVKQPPEPSNPQQIARF